MLVLSRKKNESIIINDDITVTVIEIRGDKVRIGIEAPKDCTVYRREVYENTRRTKDKYTDWTIRYLTAHPENENVRLGVAKLHRAFPGAEITLERVAPGGDTLRVTHLGETAPEDVESIEKRVKTILNGVFERYLPYHGWSILFRATRPQDSISLKVQALERGFPGAEVRIETSDSSPDQLVITPADWADSDSVLDAYRAVPAILKKADAAQIDSLRRIDRAQLRELIRAALEFPQSSDS
jgi:carbon storage regulator